MLGGGGGREGCWCLRAIVVEESSGSGAMLTASIERPWRPNPSYMAQRLNHLNAPLGHKLAQLSSDKMDCECAGGAGMATRSLELLPAKDRAMGGC